MCSDYCPVEKQSTLASVDFTLKKRVVLEQFKPVQLQIF